MNNQDRAQAAAPIIIADIYELAGRLRENGDAIAATVGQTQARWQVLSAASGAPQTVPQIARVLGVTRQNVQRIADLLVAEGAAEYRDNPDHRASPHLVLTKSGRAAFEQLMKAASGYYARPARKISPAEMIALQRGLRRFLEAVSDIEPVNTGKESVKRRAT